MIAISSDGIQSHAASHYVLTYDAAALQLLDFAAQTPQPDTAPGPVPGTPLAITSHGGGELEFTAGIEVPPGSAWSGTLTLLRFKALATGVTAVGLAQEGA